ncbi:hypothetical protein V9T40_004839 [Parthenolecanium corni]|uniref:Ninjurin-2 n=1 Tax=Parthenolecanium corni TaxID=536013 RepID=A0AAN9Y244_9HEMI
MSGANRNQNSANQNLPGENVPLTAITTTQTGDGDNNQAAKGLNSTGDGIKKDANDNSADQMYNPEIALVGTPLDNVPEGFNIYRNKKTLTQGLMDIALFSANANQLRYILEHASKNAFFYIAAILIVISLILQVGVGLLLLISTRYNLSIACQRELAYKYGNYVVAGIFLITVVNIFIAAFGGPAVAIAGPIAVAAIGSASSNNNISST